MLLGLSRVLPSGPTGTLFGEVDLALLIFVVYAGFEGTSAPDRNFAATFVFVTVWLGFPVVTTVAAPATAAAFAAPRCADWGARPTDGRRLEMTAVRQDDRIVCRGFPMPVSPPDRLEVSRQSAQEV